MTWPSELPVLRVRWARPTDRLEECVAFYRDGLGLRELGRFEGHAGYDGVLLGLPGSDYHLELTSHADGSPGPAPTTDNLLVLYLDSREAAEALAARLASRGHPAVEPENPYWDGRSVTVADPDGWRVVLDWGLAEDEYPVES
jgi:catechol 2,3-dioxygenase-like lactoylglutathione lyase family enzyme